MTDPETKPAAVQAPSFNPSGNGSSENPGEAADCDYDNWDDDDLDDDDGDLCGMTSEGTCMLAGTEHCDWDCPYNDL